MYPRGKITIGSFGNGAMHVEGASPEMMEMLNNMQAERQAELKALAPAKRAQFDAANLATTNAALSLGDHFDDVEIGQVGNGAVSVVAAPVSKPKTTTTYVSPTPASAAAAAAAGFVAPKLTATRYGHADSDSDDDAQYVVHSHHGMGSLASALGQLGRNLGAAQSQHSMWSVASAGSAAAAAAPQSAQAPAPASAPAKK